jgi:hypothetical protein
MPNTGVGGKDSESSPSSMICRFVVEYLSGLVGCLDPDAEKTPSFPFGPGLRLLLCPGTRLIGLSSSTNLNLAVAPTTPQAGVGLSSNGDEPSGDPSSILISECNLV